MDSPKEQLQKYLPATESFLTSVLLEKTHIEIISDKRILAGDALGEMKGTDIFLYLRDEESQSDIILVLDQQWYGLLSSIMLGVEEKSNNEITRDLLKKFSSELTITLKKQMMKDGQSPNPADIQILSRKQVGKLFAHEEYFLMKMKVEGLADHQVRAELLIGSSGNQADEGQSQSGSRPEDPGSRPEEQTGGGKEPEQSGEKSSQSGDESSRAGEKSSRKSTKPGDRSGKKRQEMKREEIRKRGADQEFSPVDAEQMSDMASTEEVISGRHIEFEEFEEDENRADQNGDTPRRMDLLKDVEMDVSVELGRIELPLGKVLELAKGSVIELEKLAGEPVDILVNGHRIAHGEVVVIDEHFGVRISNLITTRQRLVQLK